MPLYPRRFQELEIGCHSLAPLNTWEERKTFTSIYEIAVHFYPIPEAVIHAPSTVMLLIYRQNISYPGLACIYFLVFFLLLCIHPLFEHMALSFLPHTHTNPNTKTYRWNCNFIPHFRSLSHSFLFPSPPFGNPALRLTTALRGSEVHPGSPKNSNFAIAPCLALPLSVESSGLVLPW